MNLVVDPVGLSFMHCLDEFVVFLFAPLVVVVVEVGEVAVLEQSVNPVFLAAVVEHSISLENTVFE